MVSDDDFRLLLAANAIGALGTALISPVLSSLTEPLGVSPAEIGLVVTAVAAPPIVLIPLFGLLTDRIGRKPVLIAGLFCFGIGGLGIAFTTSFQVVLGLRALQGVGFAGITPVIITSIGDLYEADSETTAQGIRFGVSGLSQAVFPAIAGVIVGFAWQYPFLIYGLAIPIALLVFLFFNEPADIDDTESDEQSFEGTYVVHLWQTASRPRVVPYLVARGIVVLPFIGFLTYNSLVITRLQGGTPSQAGFLVALFSIVYAITATQAGRIVAHFNRPTVPLVSANVLLGGGLAAFALSRSVFVAGLPVVAMGVGVGITFSLYRSIITGLAPPQFRGGLVSIAESGGRVVATLTPIAIGIALTRVEPVLGFESALRWIVVTTGVVATAIGVTSVLLARTSRSVSGHGRF
ncbi:MFS transporter [Halopenitus sp. H-Gu1]|uniref:MFS transporter n=1 Tax=Halopenitus sp. H-Gu1 TaxID=3242697 RepID=UPI00359E5010